MNNDKISNETKENIKNFKNLSTKEAIKEIENYRETYKDKKTVNRVILDTTKELNLLDIYDTFEILENNYPLTHEVLSERTAKHSEISKNVKRQLKYIGFVYYVWNPENLNVKVIPLLFAYPILDIVNLKEFYYLQRPSIFIEGIPIWIIIRGIPVSVELNIRNVKLTDDNGNRISKKVDDFIREIEVKGYSPDEIRAKLESMFATYLFGKPTWTLRDYLMFALILIVCGLIEYLIISSIFIGA